MKKTDEKKRTSSLAAITLRLAAAVMGIWLLCMAALTIVTAQLRYDRFRQETDGYAYSLRERGERAAAWLTEDSLPGSAEQAMLSMASDGLPYYRYSTDIDPLRERPWRFQTAVAFFDANEELILHSGDYLSFPYMFEHAWQGETEGYAYIDLSGLELSSELSEWLTYNTNMRLSGYFDGAEFIPSQIEYDSGGNGVNIRGRDWVSVYEAPEAKSVETIYAFNVRLLEYDEGGPVYVNAKNRGTLLDMTLAAIESNKVRDPEPVAGRWFPTGFWSLERAGLIQVSTFFEQGEYDEAEEETRPVAFYMVSAALARPLQTALYELLYVYLFTFFAALLFIWAVRRSVKKSFTDPVSSIYTGISDGWNYVTASTGDPRVWREVHEIGVHYRQAQDKLREDKNEIARLSAALEYAKEAEEQRRQLSSNIAHELKTPLAVIRSYAEGLQEHIAEDKRDRYLQVIVGETERMDDMVLEMLDLSRLEAGKVTLARDVFDLSLLARSIFQRLEPAAEARELSISYELPENCLVNMDEARISQVIENFASNALRYTPRGGRIWVRASFALGRSTLAVENSSPPLSDETLSRVWERFYRADESRSEKSSGLGLAIARSIVELHGGHCSAKNTENGVEFSFTI